MQAGRIIEVHRTNYTVAIPDREVTATVRGNFHAEGDFPKVGDYVSLSLLEDDKAVIETVHERTSIIKRKAADSEEEQIMATNVDLICIVIGLDGDYSISRLERYLLLAAQSHISTVVVLNKTDVVDDVHTYLEEVSQTAGDVPVIAVSALQGDGMAAFEEYFEPKKTAVLLGSSGAGKSTITNWLLQEDRQAVQEIRGDDSRGRHTTTSRQLITLPNGSYLIDTPGMRELGVFEADAEDELAVFDRIEYFSSQCKFNNCDHEKSAGCAVLAALESGELDARELNNYHKLLKERAFQENKNASGSDKYQAQTQKRRSQQDAAAQRQRLSRR
jgi:ribosome biogenesis GTPase